MAIGLGLLLCVKSVGFAALLAIGLGIAFSLVSNGSIPFALSMVPAKKAGLGTGIFFSGGAIGSGLLFKALTGASVTGGALTGTGAFCLSGIGVVLAHAGRFKPGHFKKIQDHQLGVVLNAHFSHWLKERSPLVWCRRGARWVAR